MDKHCDKAMMRYTEHFAQIQFSKVWKHCSMTGPNVVINNLNNYQL